MHLLKYHHVSSFADIPGEWWIIHVMCSCAKLRLNETHLWSQSWGIRLAVGSTCFGDLGIHPLNIVTTGDSPVGGKRDEQSVCCSNMFQLWLSVLYVGTNKLSTSKSAKTRRVGLSASLADVLGYNGGNPPGTHNAPCNETESQRLRQ